DRKRGNGRLDDLDFLAPKLPAFPRMGVQAGHCQARLWYAEVALQSTQGRSSARFDQRAAEMSRHVLERNVRRHRDRPKRRSGEHHHDIGWGDPASLGDELRLPGMLEADGVKLLLRHWAGNDGRR